MSTTPDQQYLIDTKTLGSPEQCCMTLGGYVEIDDEGTPMCVILDNQASNISSGSFYLSEACGYVEDVGEDEDSAGNQNGGGFGNWLSDNLTNLTEGFADIWDAINPTTPPTPQYTPPTGGGGATPPNDNKENQTKTILIVVGVVLVLILGVYLMKRSGRS